MQKEAGTTSDPTLAVGTDATARNDTMQMWMMLQILTPGMEYGDEADLRAQVLGSSGDRTQGLGGGVKQDVVDHGLILIRNRGNRLGQRKDHMEVLNRKEVGLAIFQPLHTDQ